MYLCLCPGQRQGALECCRAAVLVGEFQHLLASRGDDGGESNARCGSGENAHGAPQTKNGVEYGARCIRERPPIDNRNGVEDIVAASKKPRAIRLELRVTKGFTFHDYHVRGPNAQFPYRIACGASQAARRHRTTNSVSTNRFENAGWATSAACDARQSSAYEVT